MEKSNDEIVLDLLKFYRESLMDVPIESDWAGKVYVRFHISGILGRGNQGKPVDIQNWEAAFPWEEKIRELTKAVNEAIL